MNATTTEREAAVGTESIEAALREEAVASLKRKRRFAENVIAYVTVNGVLWLIWAIADRSTHGNIPWPGWVSIVWGFFLAMDAWKAFGAWPRSLNHPITETDVERELERIRRDGLRR